LTELTFLYRADERRVHFNLDMQAKLDQMARDSGRPPDRRYDEMDNGKVEGIDGEEAYERLMEKTQTWRERCPCSECRTADVP
jgi:hypothetical protein